jgi:hypothetical protein
MRIDENDLLDFNIWSHSYWKNGPHFLKADEIKINEFITLEREKSRLNPRLHSFLEILPLIFLGISWAGIIWGIPFLIKNQILALLLMGLCHGIWGYSFVTYTLHEGAGHGLLKNTPFRFLAFHSSRLLFADPEFYRDVHQSHHKFLGTSRDGSFTHHVNLNRVLRSLLPGAGILFPNDYKIHQGDKLTRSLLFSYLVGGLFLGLELLLLRGEFLWWKILLSFTFLGPWVGLSLDRLRESLEHWGMPAQRKLGSKEFGLTFWGLLIGGGPWGQPCHFSHHLAPDLSWYQQLRLHLYLKKLNPELPRDYLLTTGLKLSHIGERFSSPLGSKELV